MSHFLMMITMETKTNYVIIVFNDANNGHTDNDYDNNDKYDDDL